MVEFPLNDIWQYCKLDLGLNSSPYSLSLPSSSQDFLFSSIHDCPLNTSAGIRKSNIFRIISVISSKYPLPEVLSVLVPSKFFRFALSWSSAFLQLLSISHRHNHVFFSTSKSSTSMYHDFSKNYTTCFTRSSSKIVRKNCALKFSKGKYTSLFLVTAWGWGASKFLWWISFILFNNLPSWILELALWGCGQQDKFNYIHLIHNSISMW